MVTATTYLDVLGDYTQVRRVHADTHEKDNVLVPDLPQHLNLRGESWLQNNPCALLRDCVQTAEGGVKFLPKKRARSLLMHDL